MAGGLLSVLAQASNQNRSRMHEAIEGFQTQVKQEKLKKHLRNYIQEYGMDISRESIEGFLGKNPDANIRDLGPMFEAIKMQRGAQTEGDYTLGPGMQRRGFGDKIKAEIPFKPAPISPWKEKLEFAEGSPEIAQKYPTLFGIKTDPSTIPSPMKDFEQTIYGKEVPEQRGKPGYVQKRMDWIRKTKEQSPYVDALNRQIDVTAKREGTNLRKEFYDQTEVKEATDIKRKYEVMQAALKESETTNNFVAVDQAIITLFNKMTDPQSVVRESEYARTASDLALWHRIKGKIAKWIAGGAGLTQDDRNAIFKMAGKFNEVAQIKYKGKLHEYKGYMTEYGLDPNKYLKPYGESGEVTNSPKTAEEYLKKKGQK